nr:Chain A, Backbone Solution Structure of mixed alpha/beta protein PF1061 [Pyrococcus furiosus DSM 3638]1SF0_A Chain A, BACKBONE SOLUTION STRUCTURE OF MIXED ALPHA/BETA PROTEIN PF1061 [Pyrococcus furiosus DSM 3638]
AHHHHHHGSKMIKVKVIGRNIEKEIEWREGMKVRDILRAVGFNTESAIAKVNGKVVLEDDEVKDGDFVEVIPVVSGG